MSVLASLLPWLASSSLPTVTWSEPALPVSSDAGATLIGISSESPGTSTLPNSHNALFAPAGSQNSSRSSGRLTSTSAEPDSSRSIFSEKPFALASPTLVTLAMKACPRSRPRPCRRSA